MSHLMPFKTTCSDQEALIRALIRMGFTREQIEIHEKAVRINGYHSEDNKVGHIIIRKQHTTIPSDIGWELTKDGVYVGHIDSYHYHQGFSGMPCRTHYNTEWQQHLYTYYNIECTKMAHEKEGNPCEEIVEPNGEISVVAYPDRNTLAKKFKGVKAAPKIKTRS